MHAAAAGVAGSSGAAVAAAVAAAGAAFATLSLSECPADGCSVSGSDGASVDSHSPSVDRVPQGTTSTNC